MTNVQIIENLNEYSNAKVKKVWIEFRKQILKQPNLFGDNVEIFRIYVEYLEIYIGLL